MDSGEDTQKRDFMKEGFSYYLDALYAIGEFRQEIGKRMRRKIDSKLNKLSKVMKISLSERDRSFSEDTAEIGLGGNFSRIGWIIGGFDPNSPIDKIYVSMCFDPEDPKGTQSVSISFYVNRNKDYFLKRCQTVFKDFEEWDKKEIGIFDYLTGLDSLEDKLNGVMDKWIDVWERMEGVPGLVNMKE